MSHKYTVSSQWPGFGCTVCGRARLPAHAWTEPSGELIAIKAAIQRMIDNDENDTVAGYNDPKWRAAYDELRAFATLTETP